MLALWLATGLLAGGGSVSPPVDQPIGVVWRNYRNSERKRLEQIEEEARKKLKEAVSDIPEEDREVVADRLAALLRQFTFDPLPEVGPEIEAIADRAVAMLLAEAEAEFDGLVVAMMRERDERDAIATILLCV